MQPTGRNTQNSTAQLLNIREACAGVSGTKRQEWSALPVASTVRLSHDAGLEGHGPGGGGVGKETPSRGVCAKTHALGGTVHQNSMMFKPSSGSRGPVGHASYGRERCQEAIQLGRRRVFYLLKPTLGPHAKVQLVWTMDMSGSVPG